MPSPDGALDGKITAQRDELRRRIVTRYDLIDALEETHMHRLENTVEQQQNSKSVERRAQDLLFWCEAFERVLEPATARELAELRLAVADLLADICMSKASDSSDSFDRHKETVFELDWRAFTVYLLDRAEESDRAREGRESLRMRGLSMPKCPATARPITIDQYRHCGRILCFHIVPMRPLKSGPFVEADCIVSAEEDAPSLRLWAARRKTTAIQWVADLLLPRPGLRATHVASDGAGGRRPATFITALLTDGNIGIWDLEGLYKNFGSDDEARSLVWTFPCREVISMSRLEGSAGSLCEGLWYSQQLDSFIAAHAQTHSLLAFELRPSRKTITTDQVSPSEEDFTRPVSDLAASTVQITQGICMAGCHAERVTSITEISQYKSSSSADLRDSRLIASVAADATVGIWELRTGDLVHRFMIPHYGGRRPQLRSVVYAAAIDRLVIVSSSSLVYLVQPTPPPGFSRSVIQPMRAHRAPLISVAVARGTAPCAVSCDERGEIRIWDLIKLECVQVIKGSTSGLKSCGAQQIFVQSPSAEGVVKLLFSSTKFGRVDLHPTRSLVGASRVPVGVVVNLLRSTIIIAEPLKLRVHSLGNAELITEINTSEIACQRDASDDRTISVISLSEDHARLLVGFTDGSLAVHLMATDGRPPQPVERHYNHPVTHMKHSAARGVIISITAQDGLCLIHAEHPQPRGTNLPLRQRVETPDGPSQLGSYAVNALRSLLANVESAGEGRVKLWALEKSRETTVMISAQEMLNDSRKIVVEAVAFLEPLLGLVILTREDVDVSLGSDNTKNLIARFMLKVYVGCNKGAQWTPLSDRSDATKNHVDIPLSEIEPYVSGSSSSMEVLIRANDNREITEVAEDNDLLSKCDAATKELIHSVFEARGQEALKTIFEVTKSVTRQTSETSGCRGSLQQPCDQGTEAPAYRDDIPTRDRVSASGLMIAQVGGRKILTFELHLEGDRSVLEGDSLGCRRSLLTGTDAAFSSSMVSAFSVPAVKAGDAAYTSTLLLPSTDPKLTLLLIATRHGFDLLRLWDGAVIRRHIEPFGETPASRSTWSSAALPFDASLAARMIFSTTFGGSSGGEMFEEEACMRRILDCAPVRVESGSPPSRNTVDNSAEIAKKINVVHSDSRRMGKLTPRGLQLSTWVEYFTWSPAMPSSGYSSVSAGGKVQRKKESTHLDRIGMAIDKTIDDFAWNRRKGESMKKIRRAFSETTSLERPTALTRASTHASFDKYISMPATELATACAEGQLTSVGGSKPSREQRLGARRLRTLLTPKMAALTTCRALAVVATQISEEGVNIATEQDFETLYITCLSRQSGLPRSRKRKMPKSLPPIGQ